MMRLPAAVQALRTLFGCRASTIGATPKGDADLAQPRYDAHRRFSRRTGGESDRMFFGGSQLLRSCATTSLDSKRVSFLTELRSAPPYAMT